jgi:hypothetical protein
MNEAIGRYVQAAFFRRLYRIRSAWKESAIPAHVLNGCGFDIVANKKDPRLFAGR